MVEGTGFENRHRGNLIVSSNLTASAQDCSIIQVQVLYPPPVGILQERKLNLAARGNLFKFAFSQPAVYS